MSFYKMFGYPTGIGCLIARREALCMLKRPWFSGGAVVYASVAADAHVLREGAEGFEDGTVNFLAARAVTNGLSFMKSIGMKRISSHVRMLARCLLHCLERAGEHVRIYGPANMESRGGVFAFDVLYCGQRVDARIFEREASLQGIALRTGCFCNPGASEVALGMVDNVKACVWKGRDKRMVEKCMGGWFGCVRVSVGIANVKRDIDVFADFLDSFCARVDASMLAEKSGGKGGKTGRRLGCSACGG